MRKLSPDQWNALDPEDRARRQQAWEALQRGAEAINAIPESALAVAPVGLESHGSPKLVVLSSGSPTPIRAATADERAYAVANYPRIKRLLDIVEEGNA